MGVKDDLRQRFAGLSPALQQVARYVLDHPNDVVTHSMRTVGTRSGGTPATLVRFAQHLGYAGWPQFKEAVASEIRLGPQAYGERACTLVGRATDQALVEEMFEVQRRNLEATQRQSAASLQKACALLEKAATVHAAGFRACFPIAFSPVLRVPDVPHQRATDRRPGRLARDAIARDDQGRCAGRRQLRA